GNALSLAQLQFFLNGVATIFAQDGDKTSNVPTPGAPRHTPGTRADFDMAESETLPRRPSPLPGGERSDRACAIRVRGKRPRNRLRSPLTRNVRAKRAHSDLSPMGRGEEALAQRCRKML